MTRPRPDVEKPSELPNEGKISVIWGRDDELEPVFADNLFMQRLKDKFYLTFGQLRAPEMGDDGAPLTATEIKPVAKLIVPLDALRDIRDLLTRSDLGEGAK